MLSDYPPSFSPDQPSWRDPDDLPEDGLFTPDSPPEKADPEPSPEPAKEAPPAPPEPAPEVAPPAPETSPVSNQEPSGAHVADPPAEVTETPPAAHETATDDAPVSPPAPPVETVAETAPADPSPAPRKRGPKFMTDEPTTRVEGQLFVPQYTSAMGVLARLKVENKNVPGRRRLSINSLIRVGMSIVLDHQDELHGSTEEELLKALQEALRTSIGRDEK